MKESPWLKAHPIDLYDADISYLSDEDIKLKNEALYILKHNKIRNNTTAKGTKKKPMKSTKGGKGC